MAFDQEHHEVHPDTGLHIDKRTGFPAGLAPLPIARVTDNVEYPKWVVPHEGHVSRDPQNDHVITLGWSQHHVNRATGELTVLVHNEDEELRALSSPEGMKIPEGVEDHLSDREGSNDERRTTGL